MESDLGQQEDNCTFQDFQTLKEVQCALYFRFWFSLKLLWLSYHSRERFQKHKFDWIMFYFQCCINMIKRHTALWDLIFFLSLSFRAVTRVKPAGLGTALKEGAGLVPGSVLVMEVTVLASQAAWRQSPLGFCSAKAVSSGLSVKGPPHSSAPPPGRTRDITAVGMQIGRVMLLLPKGPGVEHDGSALGTLSLLRPFTFPVLSSLDIGVIDLMGSSCWASFYSLSLPLNSNLRHLYCSFRYINGPYSLRWRNIKMKQSILTWTFFLSTDVINLNQ